MRRALLAVLPVLMLAGCGASDSEKAVDAAEEWLRAVGERDVDAACDLMRDTAVTAIRTRLGLKDDATCAGVMRTYSDAFRDAGQVLKGGLEAEGSHKKGQIGVFPISGPRELQVILMRRDGDEWKVASTTLGPAAPRSG